MSTIWAFDNIENEHSLQCGKDYMKKFCSFLREHATNTINFEKKKMLPLTKRGLTLHQDETKCKICGKRFSKKFIKDVSFQKVRDHCYFTDQNRGAVHSISNLGYNVPNEIPVVFHNGSNYDYHFIIKELASNFGGKFKCLAKNTKKYKVFLFQ